MEHQDFNTTLQELISSGHVNTLIRLLNDPHVRVDAADLLGGSEYETVINTAKHVGQEEFIKRVMSHLSKTMEI